MLLSKATRLLTTTARRSAITKLPSRSVAVVSTNLPSSRGENLYKGNSGNLGWIAAAAAMAGAATMKDEKADCCGIAGVVGAKGDAR